MPRHPITHLQTSISASCTGPYGGICQLEADKDAPTHPPGTYMYNIMCWYTVHSTTRTYVYYYYTVMYIQWNLSNTDTIYREVSVIQGLLSIIQTWHLGQVSVLFIEVFFSTVRTYV